MRITKFWAVFLTIVLAIPITSLALIASAYLTDHLVETMGSISHIDLFTLAGYRDLILEFVVLGMILGVSIIILVIHITVQPENVEKETHT
jgi:hypothetical protein